MAVSARSTTLPDWPATRPLREWQLAALDTLRSHTGEAFLASATPAAGKTTFGLRVAHDLLRAGIVARVVVAGPTTHICRQWAQDAARYGIDLEPNRPNADGPEPADRHGVAVTYQTVAAGPLVHRRASGSRPTLLIADEPHHMGQEAAWGATALEAFGPARLKLLLSGTPFRSDGTPIPWVAYDDDGISAADYTYSYTEALRDGVCRPITFLTYDGDMEWVSDGKLRHADFGVALPAPEAARRLRTALEPDGDWMRRVLRDADRSLSELRAGEHPEAGGLVIAADKESADRIAAVLGAITGSAPPVVTSDAPDASARIAAFAGSREPWLVSVLMVSEGVDIPRLRVGVYASAARTELFFRQVVGRFIRRTAGEGTQMSYLFCPADARLRVLAAAIEEERNHALKLAELPAGDELDLEPRERGEARAGFEALSSSGYLAGAISPVTEPGGTLSLFGEPEPEVAPPAPVAITPQPAAAPPPGAAFERRERLRNRRRELVSLVSRRTGSDHRSVNARINQATGARSVSSATVEQLEKGNRLLEREAG